MHVMCLVMVDDHGLVWLFMRPVCLPPPLLINLGCIFYLPPSLYIPLMKSRFLIILLCICGPACPICEIQVIISYRLIHMKEEVWK